MRHVYFLCREELVLLWIQLPAFTRRSLLGTSPVKFNESISVSSKYSTKRGHGVGKTCMKLG